MNKFWMVWVDGMTLDGVKHKEYEIAEKIATKKADEYRRDAYVLCAEKRFYKPGPIQVDSLK